MNYFKYIFFSVAFPPHNFTNVVGSVIGNSSGNLFSPGVFDSDDTTATKNSVAGNDAYREKAFPSYQSVDCTVVGGNTAFNGAARRRSSDRAVSIPAHGEENGAPFSAFEDFANVWHIFPLADHKRDTALPCNFCRFNFAFHSTAAHGGAYAAGQFANFIVDFRHLVN